MKGGDDVGLDILKYIEEWELNDAEHAKMHAMALGTENFVYGIEVRFSATKYDLSRERYDDMRDVVKRRSSGCLSISSSYEEFHSGIISLKLAFCNHGFNDRKVTTVVKTLLEEIIPSMKKA